MLFKAVAILSILNVLWALINYASGKNLFNLIVAVIYFIGCAPLYGLLIWKFRRAIRFIPIFIFVPMAIYLQ